MKTLSVHKNLDTSFVNLAALLRYLRERRFVGRVRLDLDGYSGEITLGAENQLKVEEHDRVAGRIAEGDEALQRLLIRARAPGGAIDVHQFVADGEIVAEKIAVDALKPIEKPSPEEFLSSAPATNGSRKIENLPAELSKDFLNLVPENRSPLPLEFTNRVEDRARQTQLTEQEWQTLLQIVGEILGAAEEVFAAANLNFERALTAARAEISGDYPFLHPAAGAFRYRGGAAEMSEKGNAKLLAASINESLRSVLETLVAQPRFSEVHRAATQKILAVVHRRKPLCDRFFITPQLEKILGV